MSSGGRWPAPSFDDARSGADLLDSGEVHVWCATLEPGEEVVARLRGVLDEDECRRADRFTFEAGRRQYTVGRGLLRVILGHYLAVEPTALRFRYNPYGKPELAAGLECGTLKFNLSHSGALVLYAVSRAREVGIDVETIRPEFASEGIAERFFAAGERATLRDLPPESRTHAFFTCWTRKEAFIKARGQGLSIPLDAFEVSLVPGAAPAILATHDDPAEAARWSLHELAPGAGYVAAVAVAGDGHRIRYGMWPFA